MVCYCKDILLSRVMMGVGIIFLVLHLPRTLLALYEVTRIPRILTCMVHGCRQGKTQQRNKITYRVPS